jgi:hypothetical protein
MIVKNENAGLPERFIQDQFIKLFSGKDGRWLELAATLVG